MKAHKSVIKFGSVELEVYQLPDSTYQLSKTQVGLAIEKDDTSFRSFIDGKSPEALPYKDLYFNKQKINFTNIDIVDRSAVLAYWTYWANKGNEKAINLLNAVYQTPKEQDLMFGDIRTDTIKFCSKIKNTKNKLTEKYYSDNLSLKLNGIREVIVPVGKIDILTANEIIEVKNIKDWKQGIGQIIIYGNYYPSHQKRIHLFGNINNALLDLICFHTNKLNINVSYENKITSNLNNPLNYL